MTSSAHILRVGVTGGIGSGKSLVCSMLARRGFSVLSADELAKELMLKDPFLKGQLLRVLGPSSYLPDGDLNRKHIALKIFSSSALRKKVDDLVHPRVELAINRKIAELRRAGQKVAVVEAALLVESGFAESLDVLIVVDASVRKRIERVSKRDKISADQVLKRVRAQSSSAEKLKKADYIIHNDHGIKELASSVDFIATILSTLANNHE